MRKKKSAPSPRTETARVASPYGHGIDTVQRVIDMIDAMHKRRQLDDQEYQAAITYRTAYEIVIGQAGGAMDFSRVRGGSLPGSPPLPARLSAADILLQVEKLGLIDRLVVEFACGEGRTLAEIGAHLGVRNPGHRLRESLTILGRIWHPEAKGSPGKIRVYSPDGPIDRNAKREAIRAAQEGVVAPARAVHATPRKIYQRRP